MPDLEHCITYEDKMYCWNKATHKIALVNIKDIDFKDCPECVIQTIIEKSGNRTMWFDDDTIQMKADEDGCTYVFKFSTSKWYRLCDITTADEIPEDVKEKVAIMYKSLEALRG